MDTGRILEELIIQRDALNQAIMILRNEKRPYHRSIKKRMTEAGKKRLSRLMRKRWKMAKQGGNRALSKSSIAA